MAYQVTSEDLENLRTVLQRAQALAPQPVEFTGDVKAKLGADEVVIPAG